MKGSGAIVLISAFLDSLAGHHLARGARASPTGLHRACARSGAVLVSDYSLRISVPASNSHEVHRCWPVSKPRGYARFPAIPLRLPIAVLADYEVLRRHLYGHFILADSCPSELERFGAPIPPLCEPFEVVVASMDTSLLRPPSFYLARESRTFM